MKVGQILKLNSLIKNIIDNTKAEALVKFKLLGMMKQFEACVSNFETVRNEKIREYGTEEKDEDGNSNGNICIPSEDSDSIEKYNKAMDEIINSESDITITKFKPEDIIDKGLPAEALVALYDIIES